VKIQTRVATGRAVDAGDDAPLGEDFRGVTEAVTDEGVVAADEVVLQLAYEVRGQGVAEELADGSRVCEMAEEAGAGKCDLHGGIIPGGGAGLRTYTGDPCSKRRFFLPQSSEGREGTRRLGRVLSKVSSQICELGAICGWNSSL
jgi:hypothetical protein